MLKTFTTNHPLMESFKTKIRQQIDKSFGEYRDWEYDEYIDDAFSFLDDDSLLCYVKNNEIVAVTHIVPMEDLINQGTFELDSYLLKDFEGAIFRIYSLYDEDTNNTENVAAELLTMIGETYPNVLLYTYHLNYSDYSNSHDYLTLNSFVSEGKLLIDGEYAFSKKSSINVKEILKQLQAPKTIQEVNVHLLHPDKEDDEKLLRDIFKNAFSVMNDCNSVHYDGFSYAKPGDLFSYHRPKNLRLFIAVATFTDGSQQPVGILKIADYSNGYKYIGLNYITTHKLYYRQGIAKKLYEALNIHLGDLKEKGEDVIFVSSDVSDMGKEAKINEVRKSIVTNCLTFDGHKEYSLYCQEKLSLI